MPSSNFYIETSLVIDGCLDEDQVFYDHDSLEAYITSLEADYNQASQPGIWELFIIEHDHPMTEEECYCIQYLTSHKPYWTSEALKDGE